jgi:Family of unknown function (DUF6231)
MSPPVYADDVTRLLEQIAPRSVLLWDLTASRICSPYLQKEPDCKLDRLTNNDVMKQLQTRGRYDFCFVANVLERTEKTVAGQVLARLRDLHAVRLFVVAPVGEEWSGLESAWEMADFIAYGMRLLHSYEQDGKPMQMYKFDMADYKRTPDWLNAKHWAHPERWDKERW